MSRTSDISRMADAVGRSALHNEVRDTVKVKLVHGSWKQEDTNRQKIEVRIDG